jgi:hypothetical protein
LDDVWLGMESEYHGTARAANRGLAARFSVIAPATPLPAQPRLLGIQVIALIHRGP